MISGLVLPALLALVQDAEPELWSIEATRVDHRFDGDSVLQFFEAPVFKSGDRELRASWLVVWLDRNELMKDPGVLSREGELGLEEVRRELGRIDPLVEEGAPSLFSRFKEIEVTRLAQEIYLEGPILYTEGGQVVGQAGAIYLDMVDGHGWIAEADLSVERSIRGQVSRLRVLADWLRHSADGSLRAEEAVVTSCSFDDPHFHLRTGDLRIIPRPERGEIEFDVELRHNAIQLSEKFSIPLPKLSYPAGSDYTPKFEGLRLGNSSRFGTYAEAQVNGDVGKLGERITTFLGESPSLPRGRSRLRFRWLGSRGILLDLSAKFEQPERYKWEVEVGGLPDRGEDRGIVRVDEDERDTARLWYRSRGRFLADEREWTDVSFSSQTDPGVQSEFWERDYVRYEHRDNYLHWRQARNAYYYDATLLGRVDSFRTEVEELPKVGVTRFASELFRVGEQPVLYRTRNQGAYLQRVEGRDFDDPAFALPMLPLDGIEAPFDDMLGERRVLRVDSEHAVEMPFSVPFAGIRVSPFAEVRATAWDRGVNVDDSPTRLAAFAGVRAQTSFWKRRSGGGLHQVSPFVSAKAAIDVANRDGVPVRFDSTEDPIDGDFVEVGLRSRWLDEDGLDEVDVEVRGTYQSDVPGQDDRWLPFGVFASAYRDVLGIPISFWHDGRYDFDVHETPYSLTGIGFQPSDRWGIELSHIRGRDAAGVALFEAASIATRYHWTPKWEFEGTVSIPILDNGEDVLGLVLRRLGHDFLFELEFEDRTGEGGSTFGVSFRPLLGWRQSRLGVRER